MCMHLNYGKYFVVAGRGGPRGGGFNKSGSAGGARGGNSGGFGKPQPHQQAA